MPKSVPSLNQQNWGQPLNDHLAQLNDPVNGGINIWDDAVQRDTQYWPDGAGDKDDFVGKTGYNRETGSFERWEITPQRRWVTLQKAVAPSAYQGPGNVQLKVDQAGEYFYLENNQTGSNTLDQLLQVGNIVTVAPFNNVLKSDFFVSEIIGTNKVRVTRTNYTFTQVTNGLTYNTVSGSPVITNISVPDYFRPGDLFRGGNLNGNGEPVFDSGGTILSKNSATEYVGTVNGFNNNQRALFQISRGPFIDTTYSYQIFEPTIKYTDGEGGDAFTIDNAGTTVIPKLRAYSTDTGLNETNSPLVALKRFALKDSRTTQGDLINLQTSYAIRTGDSYTNLTGLFLGNRRTIGSVVNSGSSSDPADWNGANTGNPAALTIGGGFDDSLGTLNNPVIVQDNYNSIIIRPNYKSGKVRKFTHLRFWVVGASGGKTTPMDELWGIYETGSTSGMSGGDKECKNFFKGNTAIGEENGSQLGQSGTAWNNIDEKLCVYGNLAVRSAGGFPGNITHAGTITQSSDARLKENVSSLVSADVLEKIRQIEAKRYNLKADEAKKTRFGFIAQELEEVFPELVFTGTDGMKTVNYVDMIPLLSEALKAQQEQITKLQTRLDELEK